MKTTKKILSEYPAGIRNSCTNPLSRNTSTITQRKEPGAEAGDHDSHFTTAVMFEDLKF
jgi:hypothetical protein